MGISSSSIARRRTRKCLCGCQLRMWPVASLLPCPGLRMGHSFNSRERFGKRKSSCGITRRLSPRESSGTRPGSFADMKGSVGPELIGWSHHGGPNQRFAIKDECFIHTQVDDKVWDVESGNLSPGAPMILWPKHGGPNQQFKFRGKEAR